jgi:hypothetical protein
MAGLVMFDTKNAIAATTPIATAFNPVSDTGKMGF